MSLTRVFVYGTLLAGEPNHHIVAAARFVGRAQTKPEFTLFDLDEYPALVKGGAHAAVGEVYEVDDAVLACADDFEGHPGFYQRVTITLADGTAADVYLLSRDLVDDRPVIPTGDWRAWCAIDRTTPR